LTAVVETYAERLGLAFQIVDDLLVADGEVSLFETDTDRAEARQRALDLSHQATRALAPLGERAAHLRALAAYVVDRTE